MKTRLAMIARAMVFVLAGIGFLSPASAVAGVTDLGALDAAGTSFGAAFWRVFNVGSPLGAFTDVYSFTLLNPAAATGGLITWDWGSIDLSLSSVALSGGTLAGALTDSSPGSFSFNGLGAGKYSLAISGVLNSTSGIVGLAGYNGTIRAVASATPEPEGIVMVLAGFAFVGWQVARLKRI